MSLYKVFVSILVGSLVIGSTISIGIFLFGEFGSTENKILGSIATLGFFSLAGLCSSTIYESDRYRKVSQVGLIASVVSFLFILGAIWEIFDMDGLWKPIIISIVLSIAVAHASLLLRLTPKNQVVRFIRTWTILCIVILAALISIGVILEFFEYNYFIRLVGVVVILDVLGTVLVPILHYTLDKDTVSSGAINYNNRKFQVIETSGNSETDTSTVFHYKQDGDILTCDYMGGSIKKGQLLGTVAQDGTITMRYHQINTDGELMTGICTSTPELQPNRKILLHEEWEWTSGDKTSGSSQLIEI